MTKLEILPKRFDVLDANDKNCCFRINIDVLNEAFGVGRGMYARASYPDKKDTYFYGKNTKDKFYIWMPKFYSNSSEWQNSISEDGSVIYEIAEGDRHEEWISEDTDLDALRLVFVKETTKAPYRFVGVFKCGKIDYCNHTYERVATKVRLIGNPVTHIELLDDIR